MDGQLKNSSSLALRTSALMHVNREIINFFARVDQSPFLSILDGLEIMGAIGDFHVIGHIEDCLPRYTLVYVPGSRVIDSEILGTLWAVLNETSRSAKGATMAHRNEIMDDHMNHSNWKKLIGIRKYLFNIPVEFPLNIDMVFTPESSLVRKMKRAIQVLKGSEESYDKLTESAAEVDLQAWKEGELTAQQNRARNVKSMDYYALQCKNGSAHLVVYGPLHLNLCWDQPQVKLRCSYT
jgi:hypothetical protein